MKGEKSLKFNIDYDLKIPAEIKKYLEKYYNARKSFIQKKERESGDLDERYKLTKEKFVDRAAAKLRTKFKEEGEEITIKSAKEAARSLLRSDTYMTKAEVYHQLAVRKLRESGVYSKVYKYGGSTAFWNSSFTKNVDEEELYINGFEYGYDGIYNFGGVMVRILKPQSPQKAPIIVQYKREWDNDWKEGRYLFG